MANLRVGDRHNLMGGRTTGNPHQQYILNRAGLAPAVVRGDPLFEQNVIFEKGFRFHTDNVVVDDPEGDSFMNSNAALGPVVNHTWDASAGTTFDGVTSSQGLTTSETNLYGSMVWEVQQLEPGDFTPGGAPNGTYTTVADSNLVLLVNQTSVRIAVSFLLPAMTYVTVKDITGAVDPDIEILSGAGNIDGPSSTVSSYFISNQYEHVMIYEFSSNTSFL